MKQNLTLKQRKWYKIYIETGNAKRAALEVYKCTEGSAGQIGYENLKKLEKPISDLMDDIGLTDAKLMKRLNEGIDAEVSGSGKFHIRKSYLELALKVKGKLREKIDITVTQRKKVEGEKPIKYLNDYISRISQHAEA